MTLRAQPLAMQSLTVQEEARVTVTGPDTFPLTLASLVIHGHFLAQVVELSGLQALSTGPR